MTQPPGQRDPLRVEEPPPLLGTWGRVYAAILSYLAIVIALFYVFTRVFSP